MATAPRMVASSRARSEASSLAGNSQILHGHRRRICAIPELKIVGRGQCAEYLLQMPGDGDLAHRIGCLAVFNPEPGRAAAVVTGDYVGPGPDEIGHIEAVANVGDQGIRAYVARLEVQIGRGGRGDRRRTALSMSGGDKVQFARGRTVENPGAQHAVFDQGELFTGNAFAIERVGSKAPLPQRVIDNADPVVE